MCRYGGRIYKEHYACFACRKVFRREWTGQEVICPQCSWRMEPMGLDFKAPRQSDVKQWRKVKELLRQGIRYNSCGCGGPGYRPATLREMREFLVEERWPRDGVVKRFLYRATY